ncbi:uncharacterized protein OCT59_028891 [Rhizophagus irregularis]|uniref:uncharacterized protein n=1 Tax=Rhizophagus irregularis TaxID=588596 RepID=UPI003321CE3A|nr:hypothetical protein OCT59_028891 [Rhizophagus irregularis]
MIYEVQKFRSCDFGFEVLAVLGCWIGFISVSWTLDRFSLRFLGFSSGSRALDRLWLQFLVLDSSWVLDRSTNHASIPSYQIGKDESDISEQIPLQSISFSHLERIRKMPDIMQLQGPKQKYGFGMGYAKKALDYAVRADKVEEFVTQLKVFIEETKEDLSDQ